jgi:hypothetical protein
MYWSPERAVAAAVAIRSGPGMAGREITFIRKRT